MVGVGIITCNREEFFKVCLDSVPECDRLIVINDGEKLKGEYDAKIIEHDKNVGVGKSKNEALKYLMDEGCEHLFLIEDDMEIIHPAVFSKYIEASEKTGIEHFNFGFHGPGNKIKGEPVPNKIKRINGVVVFLNKTLVGSFSYYSRNCIEKVGYFDEYFVNCMDHVDHTYRIIKEGLTTKMWEFADIFNSFNYINEQASTDNSVIRKGKDFDKRLREAIDYFNKKHGENIKKIK